MTYRRKKRRRGGGGRGGGDAEEGGGGGEKRKETPKKEDKRDEEKPRKKEKKTCLVPLPEYDDPKNPSHNPRATEDPASWTGRATELRSGSVSARSTDYHRHRRQPGGRSTTP